MDAQYLRDYRELYVHHWWWRSRERMLAGVLQRLVTQRPLRRILDVGCGDGLLFPVLARFGEPYGVEPSSEALSPDGPWRSRIVNGHLDESYQPPEPFDLVLALDVIEHLDDPSAFLAQVRRLVAPAGWFVATVPAFRSLWTTHDEVNHHVTRFTREEFSTLVRAHGFTVVRAQYFFVLLALAKLAMRGMETVLRPAPRPPRTPPAAVNAALMAICRTEQALFADRAPWFGSSLLLVAQATR
ncbi:MAG: class I SAM-dependent methyltransferase [Gemmatimonas sp.]|nr:class I SAM-dependent methyltransferase [Gemmatimonas sp.]